ncbi:hypothetical protein ACSMXM_01075 [Pacificimonas sp. ICDLI1SI03]
MADRAMNGLGSVGTLSYAAARATNGRKAVGWHRYRLLAVPRAGMPAMPRGYEVSAASDAELAALADVGPEARAWRTGQGMTPLIARRGGAVVGITWLTDRAFDEDEVRARWVPPAGCAWDTGLWVEPSQRLSRAFAALWAGTAAWLADRDLDWSVSRIADYNLGSLGPHRRMGAIELGTAAFATLGNLQIATRGRPKLTGGRTTVPLKLPA